MAWQQAQVVLSSEGDHSCTFPVSPAYMPGWKSAIEPHSQNFSKILEAENFRLEDRKYSGSPVADKA